MVSGDTVIIPPTFRETSTAATMLNIGIGLVLGALVVWFLIGPANTQRINRQADELVGKPVALMTKDDKVKAIRYLSNSGALLITKSGDKIAKHFGISKYTLYSYLDNSKTGGTNEL